MLPYIFIFLAGFFNACMDAFENENYFESIFKGWNQNFWYKRVSWQKKKKIFGYHLDSWHICKTLMIVCFCAAFVFHKQELKLFYEFLIFGSIFNLSFKLFYNVIFKIK